MKINGFESVKNLENLCLDLDDSCEDVYNDLNFVQLATAVRHRVLHAIYDKHNLFQQNRWSRTIDLNTSHIILFKSPRDVQQLYPLRKKNMNVSKFLKSCYELATRDSFGRFLINMDPVHQIFEIFFKYHTAWANSFFIYLHLK